MVSLSHERVNSDAESPFIQYLVVILPLTAPTQIHKQACTNIRIFLYIFRVRHRVQPSAKEPVLSANRIWTVRRSWCFEKKVLKMSTVQVSKDMLKSGLRPELVFTKHVRLTT